MSLRARSSSIPKQSSENDAVEATKPSPQTVLTKALQSSSNLANLLPTSTILAFQLLTPIFTNGGECDAAARPMAVGLLAVLAASCLVSSFTDSIKCSNGDVHYGFVTRTGLWMFDFRNAAASGLPDLSRYRLRAMDVVHASLTVVVFVAVAMRDKSVVRCLYPMPGNGVLQKVLDVAPVAVGFGCSVFFCDLPHQEAWHWLSSYETKLKGIIPTTLLLLLYMFTRLH